MNHAIPDLIIDSKKSHLTLGKNNNNVALISDNQNSNFKNRYITDIRNRMRNLSQIISNSPSINYKNVKYTYINPLGINIKI
jgi:hypothetical protein